MIKWIKVAFRNIVKNKRRSFVTLLAIAVGFGAVSLFRGYADNTYWGLRQMAVRGEGLGHLTIYKKGWLEEGKIEPEKYMFSQEENQRIIDLVQEDDDVILATPRMNISGLVSNGRISAIFLADGVVPRESARTACTTWDVGYDSRPAVCGSHLYSADLEDHTPDARPDARLAP